MKKILHSTQRLLALSLSLLILLSANIFSLLGLFNFSNSKQTVKASTKVPPTTITLQNSNFASTNGNSFPKVPNSWTGEGTDAGNITKGVVNLDPTVYGEHYADDYNLDFILPTYNGMEDNNVLMINSSSPAKYAYVSGSLTLSNNSYYVVSFKAYTEVSAFATFELSDNGLLSESNDNTMTIMTNAAWVTCTYFIETDTINSVSPTFKLWLGNESEESVGAVFFDNIVVNQMTSETFMNIRENSVSNSSNIVKSISLKEGKTFKNITNASFEQDLTGWTLISEGDTIPNSSNFINGVFNVDDNYNSLETQITESPTNANIYQNRKALLINNKTEGAIGFKSSTFTIEQHSLYNLSIMVKTGNLTGNARIGIVDANDETKKTYNSTISTSGQTSTFTSDWITYNFAIEADPFQNKTIYLELWLGSAGDPARGYAFFDNIVLEKLTTQNFNTASSASNCTSVDLSTISSAPTVSNGTFNEVVVTETNTTFPYEPKSWTHSTSNENAQSNNGVVNIANFNIPGLVNPGDVYNTASTYSNNILMVGNIGEQQQYYKSSVITLNGADTYYTISVKVKTQKLINNHAFIQLTNSKNILAEFTKIESNTDWTTYSINIYNKTANYSVYLQLGLGAFNQGTGYAFFDDVQLKTTTEAVFNTTSNTSRSINLKQMDFSVISENSVNGLYETYEFEKINHSLTNPSAITTGIVDTNNFLYPNNYLSGLTNPSCPENDNGNVLMIAAGQDSYYAYKSLFETDITQDSYYKITTFVKTRNLTQDEDSKVLVSEDSNEYYDFGASIILEGLENSGFTAINTEGEWKEYTIYIYCTKTTTFNIQLALGSANAYTSGEVYFASVAVDSIEASDYSDAIKLLEDDDTIDNVLAIGSTDFVEPEEDTNTEDTTPSFDWLVLPSLITGLAIILSIIVYSIKLYTKKKPKKVIVKPADYNKEQAKEREEEFNEEMNSLRLELDELQQQLLQLEKAPNTEDVANQRNQLVNSIKEITKQQEALTAEYKAYRKQNKLKAAQTSATKKIKKK